MATRSFIDEVNDLESAVGGEDRFVDMALVLKSEIDDSTLLYAGGQWDHYDKRFTDVTPENVAVVACKKSQLEFTRWFSDWLRDFREGYPRDINLVLNAGDRRGGKTFNVLLAQMAFLIDAPRFPDGTPTIGWAVSKTYRQRDELDQIIAGYIPRRFYRHQRAPEHRFTFAHGSVLRNLSADDPDSLKQGRVDCLMFNEAQLLSPRAIINGLYGTSDRGGLTLLAANPPTGPEGDWLRNLKDAIDEDPETRKITKFFNFNSKDNSAVDQPARIKNAAIAKRIDPDGADADAEGTWRRWGDLACPSWNGRTLDKGGLVGPIPQIGLSDLTTVVTRREFGRSFEFIIGGDFQRRPQAAAIMRILKVPDCEEPVYWFVDSLGTKGTEVELSTDLLGFPYSFSQKSGEKNSAMFIGDCSGSWQGAQRIQGRTSFGLLEGEGWYIVPAEVIKGINSERPRNPPVAQRLGLIQRLMEARRIRVAPECKWLIESFQKCQLRKTETGTRVPKGVFAHILDAASYAIWRLEPNGKRNGGAPAKGSFKTVSIRPSGIKII